MISYLLVLGTIGVLPLAVGSLTLWIAYLHYKRNKRIILGWILFIIGGANTIIASLFIALMLMNNSLGEYAMGTLGGYILVTMMGVAISTSINVIILITVSIFLMIQNALRQTPIDHE